MFTHGTRPRTRRALWCCAAGGESRAVALVLAGVLAGATGPVLASPSRGAASGAEMSAALESHLPPVELEPWCEAPGRGVAGWPAQASPALIRDMISARLAEEGVPRPRRVGETLVATARKHDLDPLLIVALIEVESGYQSRARSAAGALGLLQVRPATAKEVAAERGLAWRGSAQLLEPETNVRLGTLYLAELLDQFDDLEHALAAYNRGPAAISRALSGGGAVPRMYVERVSQAYEDLRVEIDAKLPGGFESLATTQEPERSLES